MAYFEHEQEAQPRRRRVFQQPVEDEQASALQEEEQAYLQQDEYTLYDEYDEDSYDEDAYDEDLYEDDMSEEEKALARRDHWRVLAGVGDFLAVVAGAVVILVLIALLVSLVNWVHADITQSFTLWQTKI